jgi:hypothetical protein
LPASVADRVYDDSASTEPSRANRMEGVRIALAVSRWSASSSESRPTSSAGSAW